MFGPGKFGRGARLREFGRVEFGREFGPGKFGRGARLREFGRVEFGRSVRLGTRPG
ncbi:MAG: hypothetical protein ABW150_16755 [Candidatus Thiodiazotropha sp.]